MKFYEVQRKMNNLQWISLAFLRKKADADEVLLKVKESYKEQNIKTEDVFGAPLFRIEERNFSNLKDFDS